jgi:hypothetical protein
LRGLLLGIFFYLIGQILIWFQTNGQFISPWVKRNPLIVSAIGGTIISYMFIRATALIAEYYDGMIWPGRFIGFAAGIISFAYLTRVFMGEGLNIKTLISLGLALTLIAVQIFWK